MERLGLGWVAVSALNERLICRRQRLQAGRAVARSAGQDLLVQSLSGMAWRK